MDMSEPSGTAPSYGPKFLLGAQAIPASRLTASFGTRFVRSVQEGVLLGVKWGIVTLCALAAIGWFVNDYAAVRDQARYVAAVREANARAQAAPVQPPVPAPAQSAPPSP